jgi:hypothetical protein
MERARASTITMAVAAETPPRKARRARAGPASWARARTKRSGLVLGEVDPAQEGQGEDGQVDEEEVEGKGPGGQGEVAWVYVLHHAHVELPGQEEEGQAREEGEAHPVQVAGKPLRGQEEGPELRPLRDLQKGVSQEKKRGQPHQEEGEKLHRGLKGHGQDQALVPLRGVQAAGAEEDGEEGQEEGGDEGHVRHGGPFPAQEEEGLGDGLELQGQVGEEAQHQKRGRQGGQGGVAVAQEEVVRPGGEAVGPGQLQKPSVEEGPEEEDQGGPQVDGEEGGPLGGRPAHAAEEGPGGGVDGQGEGVDPGASHPGPPPPLSQEGHQEEEGQVEEEAGEEEGRAHGLRKNQ